MPEDQVFSDELDNELEDPEPDPTPPAAPKDNLRELREAAKRGRAAVAELEALKREHAFLASGLPDTPAAAYFKKAYDGEMSPEAIKVAATEAGFITPTSGVPAGEVTAHTQIAQASVGGAPPPPAGSEQAVLDRLNELPANATAAQVREAMIAAGRWAPRE